MQEISTCKTVSEQNDNLKKRQDKLIESFTAIVRSTTSLKEIESLEGIAMSMNPTISAVRDSNTLMETRSFMSKPGTSRGNIIPHRRLFSTKKQRNSKKNGSLIGKSKESNAIALNLLT